MDDSGDPGFVLSVTNKTGGKVYVYSGRGWTVKGASVSDAVLRAVVDPGQTTEEFLWFDRGDLGAAPLSGLTDVAGAIVVEDFDTGAVLGEYAFEA